MEVKSILSPLGLQRARDVIEPAWEESAASMPPGGPEFLQRDFVADACAYVGLTGDETDAALRAAEHMARDPHLAALAWHGHRRLYDGGPSIRDWPQLGPDALPDSGMFYVVVLLSGYRRMREVHQAHSIPAGVVSDTLEDVGRHVREHVRLHGHPGLTPLIVGGWLTRHLRGRLYRLGRLQFLPARFPAGQRVFRGPEGETVVLAEAGVAFRRDGQKNGASGVTETDGVWTSSLTGTAGAIAGNVIDLRTGSARPDTMMLDRARWREALGPGDAVLDVHIPAIGPLTPDACADSIRRATAFFPHHFPELPPARALTCTTWMLDVQLAGYLGEDANILRFQRRFGLHPTQCDGWSAVRSVFRVEISYGHAGPVDLSDLPRSTSLQRALLDHLAAGKRWRKGGGFILAEDLR